MFAKSLAESATPGVYAQMGYKRVETLGDVIRFGLRVKVICGNAACQRERVVFASDLARKFGAGARLDQIGQRMKCQGEDLIGGGCGWRGAVIGFIQTPSPDPPPPPDGSAAVVDLTRRLAGSERIEAIAKRARR